MARRTGLSTLQALARGMCRIIVLYSPIIRAVYPDATALHAALVVASEACEALEKEIADTLPPGV